MLNIKFRFSDLRDLLTPKEEFCAQNLINKVPSYRVPENPSNVRNFLEKKFL